MNLRQALPAVLSGLLLVPTLTLPAFAAEQETAVPPQTREERAQHAVELAAQYGGADSIRYALWEDGEITLQGGAGVYSRSENRALTEDILYGVGSVSKTYTAAAVLKLSEEGRLDLNQPVTAYLPDFRMADERYRDITVRMLLDHSSGLMGDTTQNAFLFDDRNTEAADRLLERLAPQRLKADPGAYCVYSNDGFTLAELVVEAVSGMDFMDYVRTALLDPLGLEDTYAPGDGFDASRLARTYASAQDTRPLPQDTLGIVGAGGIYATASDLAAFGGALSGTELLGRDSLDAMSTDWSVRGMWPEDSADDQLGYGLGWDNVHMFPFNQNGITALVKGGDTMRYHAGLIVLPDHDKAVAVLSSGGLSPYNQLAGARILIDALAEDGIAVDESYSFPEAEKAPLPEELREYAGTYGGLGSIVIISFGEDGSLYLTPAAAMGGRAQTYSYYSDGTFRDGENTILLRLATETNGRRYLFQKGYSPIPGLTVMGTANYGMERLEPNTEAAAAALEAWAARSDQLYLIVNERYTSQVYLSNPFTAAGVLPEAAGYAAMDRIVDETHARQWLELPGTGSRNGADYTLDVKDGVEYLHVGPYQCISDAFVEELYGGPGAYCTILEDGHARWFHTGSLAGKTLSVTLPEQGGFTVYDQTGAVAASSVAFGDTSVVLPENGWIVFAGETGMRFHLSVSE